MSDSHSGSKLSSVCRKGKDVIVGPRGQVNGPTRSASRGQRSSQERNSISRKGKVSLDGGGG